MNYIDYYSDDQLVRLINNIYAPRIVTNKIDPNRRSFALCLGVYYQNMRAFNLLINLADVNGVGTIPIDGHPYTDVPLGFVMARASVGCDVVPWDRGGANVLDVMLKLLLERGARPGGIKNNKFIEDAREIRANSPKNCYHPLVDEFIMKGRGRIPSLLAKSSIQIPMSDKRRAVELNLVPREVFERSIETYPAGGTAEGTNLHSRVRKLLLTNSITPHQRDILKVL